MKKKSFGFISFACVTCFSIVSSILFCRNRLIPSKASDENAIIFNSEKNILGSEKDVTTEKGNTIRFDFAGLNHSDDCWECVDYYGFFYNLYNTETTNQNAIHDLKTISFNFADANLEFTMHFSSCGLFDTGECWSRTYKTKTGGQIVEFEGHPRYFKFVSNSANTNIKIIDMKISYGCNASADTSWDDNHGVNAIIDSTGSTLTYGLYPQTFVSDGTLVDILTDKANELGVNDKEYFWYNEEYYVKDTANPNKDYYTFSDEKTAIIKGNSYFFKCEPIKWNIKEKDKNSNYTINCANVLYGYDFADSSNAYKDSHLRTWLNNDFYNKAFFLNNSLI